MFLMDPWWNPAVEDQAADRAHRIGQERPVFVHKVIAADTVEERILHFKTGNEHWWTLRWKAGGRSRPDSG